MTFLRSTAAATVLLSAATAAPALAQAPQATPTAPVTKPPTTCLAEVVQYRKDAIQAAQSGGKPIDAKALSAELVTRAKECVQLADTTALDLPSTVDYGRLQMIAGDTSSAIGAFDKVAESSSTGADRVKSLLAVVRYTASSPHADEYLSKLDKLPNATAERFQARRALLGYYLNYDIDDKLEATAQGMLALARTMPAADQQKEGAAITDAYRALASTYANRLHPDSSLAILRGASAQQPNLPNIGKDLENDIARYEMIGKQAPTLNGQFWVNAPVTSLSDTVSLVIFTANWCHSCRDSYPTVKKLHEEMGGKKLRVALAIQLDGVFEGVAMKADQEVEANRSYYAKHVNATMPIALQAQAEDETAKATNNIGAFRVRGLPTFVVVDKKGTIRAILTGWDPYGNRARALTAVVSTLTNAS